MRFLKGPAWIGENCHIRAGCYVRENVIVGNGVVMGNSCEFKNCIVFDDVQVPHFSYVGDSILGYKAHLGAGVILSNVKLDHAEISVLATDGLIATGLRKFGAIIGDRSEIGCNAVLNPGSVVGRDCIIYPGTNFRGVLTGQQHHQSAANNPDPEPASASRFLAGSRERMGRDSNPGCLSANTLSRRAH